MRQLRYNVWLADEAHARGLSIGLKNDEEQVQGLLPLTEPPKRCTIVTVKRWTDFSCAHTPIGLHFSGRALAHFGWALVSTYSGGHPTAYTWWTTRSLRLTGWDRT
jgi:hypothetical protein